jgi:mono/diheme cytochrome c family protein
MRKALIAVCTGVMLSIGPAPAEELDFSEEFMTDMANIRAGRDLFHAQCGHCHGSRAYPGKAPRLRPERYDPEFVFWVIQGGYGRMPSFEERFTEEETKQIVAWVMSSLFSH